MSDSPEGNPLLATEGLPVFSRIRPEHVIPAVEEVLREGREIAERAAAGPASWADLVLPLESHQHRLDRVWSPVRHLQAVMDSEDLRAAYNACLPRLSAHYTDLGQHQGLFQAYRTLAGGEHDSHFDAAQRKVIEHALRDFRLSGVGLPADARARFKAVSEQLASLSAAFEQNLLDATHAWNRPITRESDLDGLPETALAMAREAAARAGVSGWLLTLEFPMYTAVMTHARDRDLRREVYEAYSTRASDQGPHAGRWDNGQVMEDILRLRHELARLLGFPTYCEYSLARKMAGSAEQVLGFLHDLARRARPVARRELAELEAFAREQDGLADLQAWDVPYYTELFRQRRYELSQEDLRPFFSVPDALEGLFELMRRLYGVAVRPRDGAPVWHPDARYYELRGPAGEVRGGLYLDLYARPRKRGGAWMDVCVGRMRTERGVEHPVAYLVCNFSPPIAGRPSLLTHNEVITLFHEFGHGLHHLLTRVDYPSVAGINGVAWDAVELPSQLMERWCWEREVLDLFARHHETRRALPEPLYQRLRGARNFHAGMQMVRQLEFALFDFRLHHEYVPGVQGRIQALVEEVRDEVAVVRPPSSNRFAQGFSHIFSGGYAAGYYSYKWAEVLASDAFSLFEERGVLDPDTGRRFMHTVLEQGGARDAMDLFVEFRGRPPTIDALLRHSGLAA